MLDKHIDFAADPPLVMRLIAEKAYGAARATNCWARVSLWQESWLFGDHVHHFTNLNPVLFSGTPSVVMPVVGVDLYRGDPHILAILFLSVPLWHTFQPGQPIVLGAGELRFHLDIKNPLPINLDWRSRLLNMPTYTLDLAAT